MCFREEEDEAVLGRLQHYKQQYQDIQTDYSKAKMIKKLDPHEENRKLLLAGGDPTKRQRELQVAHLCFGGPCLSCFVVSQMVAPHPT